MGAVGNQLLLDRLVAGEQAAFSILFDMYWEPLYRYAQRLLHDNEDAEDVVQETFASLFKYKSALKEVTSLKAYLFTILRHHAVRVIQKKLRQRDFLSSFHAFLSQLEESPEEQFFSKEFATLVNDEVQKLPAKMREIFILSREHQLSYKEIAERLGISHETVKKQVYNSLKQLRSKRLTKEFIDLVVFYFIIRS